MKCTHRILLAASVISATLSASRADEVLWDNVSGGVFQTPTNWAGEVTPSANDISVFDLESAGYTVTSSQDIETAGLTVRSDTVTLELGAHTWVMPQENTLTLFVAEGPSDIGQLKLSSGTLSAGRTRVGHTGDAEGLLVVDGPNSHLTLANSSLFAGGEGTSRGELRIINGGDVSVLGTGETNFYLGPEAGSTGIAMVSGEGSSLTVGGQLFVGERGTGEIQIANSASVEAENLVMGGTSVNGASSSNGVISVTHATLAVNRILQIGFFGSGALNFDGGSSLISGQIQIGAGSSNDPSLYGTGTLSLRNGAVMTGRAELNATSATVASFNAQSEGTVSVAGGGTQWLLDGGLSVGSVGSGRLLVEGSGFVECLDAQVARTTTASGEVVVDGTGSQWTINDRIVIGGAFSAAGGQGNVDVINGGKIIVGHLLHVWNLGEMDVTSGGSVDVGNSTSPAGLGEVKIGADGTLSGNGTIIGNVIVDYGTVSPGASPGALNITGNYNQLPGSVLSMEIGGTMPGIEYDQLLVTGNLSLQGDVQISFINGFLPQLGNTFELFTAGGSLTPPGSLNFLNAPPAYEFSTSADNGVFLLTVTAVPEFSGDFDLDGDVDGRDFLLWQRGGSPNPLSASDLVDWQTHYSQTATSANSISAIPEPNTLSILIVVCYRLCGIRRPRKCK